MTSNLDKYQADLETLIAKGTQLELAIQAQTNSRPFQEVAAREMGKTAKEVAAYVKTLPQFTSEYQEWYSEARAVISQLLPDRLADFIRHYEKPKPRKDITYENYRIEDALQGLQVTFAGEKVVGADAAIPHFSQQLSILKAAKARFRSSLFDIKQLVAADLLDSEIETAVELAKNGFHRAAGAVAGVVIEKHLRQVCDNHAIITTKKHPTIGDLNNSLKAADVVDVPTWRFIQHLADIRNLADHDKRAEPTTEQIADLIQGVRKLIKTLF